MVLDEPMSPHIFDKLTCDPGTAWELCRNYVGFQLLGQDAVTVPFLDDAYHYVPFGVVVKRKKGRESSSRSHCRSTYAIIGSMAHVTAPHVDKSPFHQRPQKVLDYRFNDRFVYRISGMRDGVKKAVKIKVNGTECYDVSLSMELGRLVLDKRLPELNDVKKLYVIFEVFYAQSISVSVTIGENQPGTKYMDTTNRKFTHDRRMPIGFNAQKFPLMSNGCVGFMEKTTLDGLREGRWKRVSRLCSDPLPMITPECNPWSMGVPCMGSRRNPRDSLPCPPPAQEQECPTRGAWSGGQKCPKRCDPLPQCPAESTSSSD